MAELVKYFFETNHFALVFFIMFYLHMCINEFRSEWCKRVEHSTLMTKGIKTMIHTFNGLTQCSNSFRLWHLKITLNFFSWGFSFSGVTWNLLSSWSVQKLWVCPPYDPEHCDPLDAMMLLLIDRNDHRIYHMLQGRSCLHHKRLFMCYKNRINFILKDVRLLT